MCKTYDFSISRREISVFEQNTLFYKQLHFSAEPRVAIENAQNEPESCYGSC